MWRPLLLRLGWRQYRSGTPESVLGVAPTHSQWHCPSFLGFSQRPLGKGSKREAGHGYPVRPGWVAVQCVRS